MCAHMCICIGSLGCSLIRENDDLFNKWHWESLFQEGERLKHSNDVPHSHTLLAGTIHCPGIHEAATVIIFLA